MSEARERTLAELDPYAAGGGSGAGPGELPDRPAVQLAGGANSSEAASCGADCDHDHGGAGDGDAESQRCNGRLFHIREAPEFLEDEEWCEAAPFVEQLRATYDDWREDDNRDQAGGDDGEEPPPPPPDEPEAELSARDLALFDAEHQVRDS
jgi:hypothetical protein